MTHEQKEIILSEITNLLKEKGTDKPKFSQNKLANKAGISSGYMSLIVKRKWDKIADKTWIKVALNLNIKFNDIWITAETSNYLNFHELLKTTQRKSMCVGIAGDAGYGKTEAYEGFVKSHDNAFLVQFDEYWTKKIALQNFMRSLGLDPTGLTSAAMSQEIIVHLKSVKNPILILDELDKSNHWVIMFFISLYNKLNGHCSLVASGSLYFKEMIEKYAREDKRGYKEFLSRIGKTFIIPPPPSMEDVAQICTVNGVSDQDEIYRIYKTSENDIRRVRRSVEKIHELKAA